MRFSLVIRRFSAIGRELALICIVVAVGAGSYEFGAFMSLREEQGITIQENTELDQRIRSATTQLNADLQACEATHTNQAIEKENQFVASKSGKVYYPTDCSAISRIKPENRVYFASEAEAQKNGLTRSTACATSK